MRPESKKSLKFERNLTRYGMMAVAAAAAAAPAQAGIIVWDPEPDVTTPVGGWVYFHMTTGETSTGSLANWDFQLFHFQNFEPSYSGGNFWTKLYLTNNGANAFVGGDLGTVARLGAGVTVESASPFGASYGIMAQAGNGTPVGGLPWNGPGQGYIGLRFLIGADTHYGWAEVTVNQGLTATLNRFGYEDVAGASVETGDIGGGEVPEPGSMSLMILGAAGLAAYRRLRKRKAA